jgi:TetR/AcrR family transcriptional regulator, repressor of the ameABC operon
MTTRRRFPREQSRERMISAAEELIRANGYAEFNVKDVAAVLEMTPANIYSRFSSKLELADAVCLRYGRTLLAQLAEIATEIRPATLAFRRLLENNLDYIRISFHTSPHLHELVITSVLEEWASSRQFTDGFIDVLRRLFEAGMVDGSFRQDLAPDDAEIAFHACTAVLHPTFVRNLSAAEAKRRITATVDLLIRGLR